MKLEKANLTGLQGKMPGFIKPIVGPLARFTFFITARVLRECYPEKDGRLWSNRELKKFAHLFEGDVINVSGWEDQDKEGGQYADYFTNKKTYTISNVGEGARGTSGDHGEVVLDLEAALPESYKGSYDTVFNHTTLEHVYDVNTAVKNLCDLSRDMVVLVVPFLQMVHWEPGSYGDYWRFTPFALAKLLENNGLHVLYMSHNDNPLHAVYLFCAATRNPDKWQDHFPRQDELTRADAPGTLAYRHIVR
ncbi:MAG: hypothetical protein JEZ02_02165 [Desulfatibacillum sp.]|nr:hypothetical protein [Desulfatibacillum sp.]